MSHDETINHCNDAYTFCTGKDSCVCSCEPCVQLTEPQCCVAGECTEEPGHVTPSDGHCPNCCPENCTDCGIPSK